MTGDASKTVAAVWIPIIVSISLAVGGGLAWFYERYSEEQQREEAEVEQLAKENSRLVREYLVRIKTKLEETKSVSDQLNEDYLEQGWGILESYVIKARQDGHDRHALMFQLISRLVRRNAEIVELLEGYAPYIQTEQLRSQSMAFREHAKTYIDRWEAIPKVVETERQLPVWKVFPSEFPEAVNGVIEARGGS
jgi:hypothetical protein